MLEIKNTIKRKAAETEIPLKEVIAEVTGDLFAEAEWSSRMGCTLESMLHAGRRARRRRKKARHYFTFLSELVDSMHVIGVHFREGF